MHPTFNPRLQKLFPQGKYHYRSDSFFQAIKNLWNVENLRLIFATNFIEFVDLYFFIHCAPIIEKIFCPPELHGHMTTFALWISYFVPPVAAFFFAYIGDKRGRKVVMVYSSALMAALTIGLVMLPSYSQIGMTSLILFCLIRFAQAVSIAGEGACAWVFGFESTSSFAKTAFNVPFISTGEGLSGVASLGGFLFLFWACSSLSEETIVRILFGMLALGFLYVLWNRKRLQDVEEYLEAKSDMESFRWLNMVDIAKYHKHQVFCLMGIMMLYPLAFNISYIYMPELMKLHCGFTDQDVMSHNIWITCSEMMIAVTSGYVAYKLEFHRIVDRRWLALGMALVSLAASIALYAWFRTNTPTLFMITLTQVIILFGVLNLAFLIGNFYKTFSVIGRYSCAAISWAFARIIGMICGILPMQYLHSLGGYDYFIMFIIFSCIQCTCIYLSKTPSLPDFEYH